MMNTDPTILKRILAANLARHRKRLGLTQKDLAARAGIGHSTCGAYEETRNFPTISNLASLANALGVTVAELLTPNYNRKNCSVEG